MSSSLSSSSSSQIIVPFGIECAIATLLQTIPGLRNEAFPFDWNLTYGSMSLMFKEEFSRFFNFIPGTGASAIPENVYGVRFFHDHDIQTSKETQAKYKRRITRLQTLLKTEDPGKCIHFIRLAHRIHHHKESKALKTDEYTDLTELSDFLTATFPKLSFRISLIWSCSGCTKPVLSDKGNMAKVTVYFCKNDKNDCVLSVDEAMLAAVKS